MTRTELNAKFKFIKLQYFDFGHFQMWEAKFQDMDQSKEVYMYVNLGNNEYDLFDKENYVRAYPYSFKDLCCAEDYELTLNNDYAEYFKDVLIKGICDILEFRKEMAK